MQVVKVEVTPVDLSLKQPVRIARSAPIRNITAIFVRFVTQNGQSAWGCTIAQPDLTGEKSEDILRVCKEYADLVSDLHPTNIEYSLAELEALVPGSPSALCAFDLAYYDLLSLAADIPLYRLLGGYRNRIQTSITIPISSTEDTVELACRYAKGGFRMLKVKGGIDPDEDVQRIKAIHRVLPSHILRLDADGCYSIQQAVDVARALAGELEMLEQPTLADDLPGLRQVTLQSPIPILADQSLHGLASGLELAAGHYVHGLSIKLVTSGGLQPARQIDAIARAARIATMISCLIEPALLVAAGLSLALSSPNVRYCDLDGFMSVEDDPSQAGFRLEEGWLVAADVPGLGYRVDL